MTQPAVMANPDFSLDRSSNPRELQATGKMCNEEESCQVSILLLIIIATCLSRK